MIEGLIADINGPSITLTDAPACRGNAARWLSIGPVQILFSYAAPVGANLPGVGKFRNADFEGRSTTAHLSSEGFRDRPAIPGDDFARLIALALSLNPSAPTYADALATAWHDLREARRTHA